MKFQISDFRFTIGAIGALAASISVVPTFRSASAPFSAVVLHAQKIDTKAAADAIMQADRRGVLGTDAVRVLGTGAGECWELTP
jgi:hypothetical protein